MLGKKWVAVIIWSMQDKKMRFGELQRAVEGCSKKMLVQQLELLISNNIIINEKKRVNNKVESTYYLSDSGLLLLPIMDKMINWSNNNLSCERK
ncbi:winged helix-turn-helix transcriptional regulator [Clostridium mediterraneense]|uniref:winged helix-turn-helix transcriptional regulator n=1 Tax=Clostridium mediterraneense TaxID=1805472 RepID=UPI0038994FD0